MNDSELPYYSRLGQPTSKNGAFCIARGKEGVILMMTDIYKTKLQAKGIVITPEIEQIIVSHILKQQTEFDRHADSLGIPDNLKSLLEYTKKSKVVAYCNSITISEDDLALLAHNCSQIGFNHSSKFTEFVPENRRVLNSDIFEMKRGNPRLFTSKIDRIIEERKRYHVHLFEKDKEWHIFYYTYKDLDSGKQGHWELGSHLHYISYLWVNFRKRQIWDSFDKRTTDIHGGVHIKLKPFVFPEEPFRV